MAENMLKNVLSVCATRSDRLPQLPIKNGQLIFIQDKCRIAFDYGDKRKFYNQIELLEADYERVNLEDPVNGHFYFVVDTAVLWFYQNDWVQLTTAPEEIIFIGTEMPELGVEKTLYVDKDKKEISVWDDGEYIVVSDKTNVGSISESDIDLLFA